MTPEPVLTAALALAAGAAAVRTPGDLAAHLWPRLADLVPCAGVRATGFDGATLAWPGARPAGGHRVAVDLERAGARARVVLDRAAPFDDRDLALLRLVRPHLADALWRVAGGGAPVRLTPRERRILAMVARGATDRAIAHELGISCRTVGKHLENVYTTLGVHDRTSAAMRVGAG
ncbi:helix-turn-helix transcriptional regulator [Actinomycetospora lemnae]|uniref:LuxR C-terminal-related transcriptional regulator n=1 Tax=Actinomycetospora lemnae TaxID=3019891 RepID=A0ABT5SNF8_9PSEU|nr:LuxR C-terminal-related transcriptional regulator [Actinomycetospora sp. DW7H6]MDD7964376.1 LuxR C-terminal-related transcriptional regulator [Actinomycetospora sp. DW7H6]